VRHDEGGDTATTEGEDGVDEGTLLTIGKWLDDPTTMWLSYRRRRGVIRY